VLLYGIMVEQCEAVSVTTELINTVYLVRPCGIGTVNPWTSEQQRSILLSTLVKITLSGRVEKSAEVFRKQNMMSLSVPEFFRTAGNKSATLPCFMCVLCALAL
jgi:hypothetical protein